MSTRHIARTLALQTLFELDMKDELGVSMDSLDSFIIRNRDEQGDGIQDISFAKNILVSALSRRGTLDDIITKAAPDWPLDKIGVVDRNILRMGLTELLFGDRAQVPPKVAIDEAIELAKTFGGETSGKFVNGVLGAIYKEMGEPEKNQVTKSREDHLESGRRELLSGAVVVSTHEGKTYVGLVHDVFGYWTLPKGHVQPDEGKDGVIREVKKELGVTVEVLGSLGENEYIANKPEIGKVVKHVDYYLTHTEYQPLTLEKKGGLDDAKWFDIKEIGTLRIYDDIKPILQKAILQVKESNTNH